MAPRNQNLPPRSPSVKKEGVGTIPFDKRRKLEIQGTGRRQALSEVNRQDVTVSSDVGNPEHCGKVEFTKEEVMELLNMRPKAGKFDSKAKIEQMTDIIKRLKICVKWFQQVDESHEQEKENLCTSLESAEKRYSDRELEIRAKEEELLAAISELKENKLSLEKKLSKEESEKQDAIESQRREKEFRVAAEKMQASTHEELERVQQEKTAAKQKVTSIEDMYRRLQEYNTSLQQYNSKLQNDVESVREALNRAEKEKYSILENLSTLRGHNKSLQDQLSSSRASQDEAIKQKESLVTEVGSLRNELQQVRDDRNRQSVQLQKLADDIVKYKERVEKSSQELDSLEETCSAQRKQIKMLEHELASAKEKLQMYQSRIRELVAQVE